MPNQTDPELANGGRPGPSFMEQAIATVKILLIIGSVLAGIWLLDFIAVQ